MVPSTCNSADELKQWSKFYDTISLGWSGCFVELTKNKNSDNKRD